mgnify:CR=1 FL=1
MKKDSAFTVGMVESNFKNWVESAFPDNPPRKDPTFTVIKGKINRNRQRYFLNHSPKFTRISISISKPNKTRSQEAIIAKISI